MTGSIAGMPEPFKQPSARSPAKWWRTVLALLLVAGIGAGWWNWYGRVQPLRSAVTGSSTNAAIPDSLARAPAGVRIRVRVINATDQRGLARKATLVLRDFGYDVVDFDADRRERRERSVVVSHALNGVHADWSERIKRAMGTTLHETSTDSSRYVDFTVLVGRDWQAPPQTLRP